MKPNESIIERKLIHLSKKLNQWKKRLDQATNLKEISEAVRMIDLYENAMIQLEAKL